MPREVGKEIKKLAKYSFVVFPVLFAFFAIEDCVNVGLDEYAFSLSLLGVCVGMIVGYLVEKLIYALGEVVDCVSEIKRKLNDL